MDKLFEDEADEEPKQSSIQSPRGILSKFDRPKSLPRDNNAVNAPTTTASPATAVSTAKDKKEEKEAEERPPGMSIVNRVQRNPANHTV